jgi:cell division protein FtsB
MLRRGLTRAELKGQGYALFHDESYTGGQATLYADGKKIADVKGFTIHLGVDLAAEGVTDKTVLTYTEGCGKPDCRECRRSREAFARIDGWNAARKKEKLGLAETLTNNSLKTITTQIDGYFEGQIKAKEQAIDINAQRVDAIRAEIERLNNKNTALHAEIKELKLARDTVAKAVTQSIPKERGQLFHRASRTGESGGHYIERFKDGTMTCTCQAAIYGSECWAQRELRISGNAYKFWGTATAFDREVAAARARSLGDVK